VTPTAPRPVERGAQAADVIAIINSTPDAIDMLRVALQPIGAAIVSTYTHDIRDGRIDFAGFMRQHRPRVIVYDIAPPYDQNWLLLQHLRSSEAMRGIPIVITSTNAPYVQDLAGRDEQVYEVIGKSEDLGRIVQATKEALRVRRTR
jgi:CheY-like chemotaxis protein